jgi:hypothetical protein
MNVNYFNKIKIKKASGDFEPFSPSKFYYSLKKVGLHKKEAQDLLFQLKPHIKRGISTKKLYQMTKRQLSRSSHRLAAHYGLHRALLELGPEGFVFEQFIAKVLSYKGFKTKTNNYIKGKCVNHEIDIIARNENDNIFIECKFHNRAGLKNELKTSLYVHARSVDVKNNIKNQMTDFWLVSNTKCTSEALQYAQCAGLIIISPNSPAPHNFFDWLIELNLQPLSILTRLKKRDCHVLYKNNIFFIHELQENPHLLNICKISPHENDLIQIEIDKVLKNEN